MSFHLPSIRRNIVPLLLTTSLVLTILAVLQIQFLFQMEIEELVSQRDEQLFSLAYSVDNNINLKIHEVSSELDYIICREDFQQVEKEMMEEGAKDGIRSFFVKSHIFNKPSVNGIVVMHDGEQIFSADSRSYEEKQIEFVETSKHGYVDSEDKNSAFDNEVESKRSEFVGSSGIESEGLDFVSDSGFEGYGDEEELPDHVDSLKADSILICYDKNGQYYIAVEKDSTKYDIQYYALFDLNHFHDAIIPESIRETYWIVFYDMESGMTMQNHRNQEAYSIFTEEEIIDRQDGYTTILEYEKQGKNGSKTYKYANYYGKVVPERLVVLPSCETMNGIFAIGISMDSENLYRQISHDKREMMIIIILFLFGTIIIFGYIYRIYMRIRHKRYEAEVKEKEDELIRQLEEARLKNSISQLQPHFLYNALASIRELILDEPEYASDLLYDFTHYLRACVRSISQMGLVPFTEELENIKAYASIEKMRFGDGLQILYDIQVEDFEIIPLGIQPLVENAIRHGIVKRRGKKGTVRVRSFCEDGQIVVTVEDDGIGFDPKQIRQEILSGERDSTGIQNLMLRFEQLMQASVDVFSEPGKGTKIVIQIPM